MRENYFSEEPHGYYTDHVPQPVSYLALGHDHDGHDEVDDTF